MLKFKEKARLNAVLSLEGLERATRKRNFALLESGNDISVNTHPDQIGRRVANTVASK